MTGVVIELSKKSGIRQLYEKLTDAFTRKPPQVCDVAVLDVDTGLLRDDDCYSCDNCKCTHYAIHRDGTLGCWGCGRVMIARWYDPGPEEAA